MKQIHILSLVLAAALLGLAGCAEDGPEARREKRGNYTIVWLHGTPYEMGRQHGTLLREELKTGAKEIEKNLLLKAMFVMSKDLGLLDLAYAQSYPEIIEECKGLTSVTADIGWTMEHCMVLNFGDAVAEFLLGMPKAKDLAPGCSQVVATGKSTADGRLYHARIMDWTFIEFIVKYPIIFVRQPTDGVAHVIVGFPGNLSPYQGMNAEGISIASNEIEPRDNTVNDLTGRSHVQMQGKILASAKSLADVRDMVKKANHMSNELFVAADGNADQAEVFEMSPTSVDIIGLKDGVLSATNHFRGPKTSKLDRDPAGDSTMIRFERLQELITPAGKATTYGKLTPAVLVEKVLRDRTNPRTGVASGPTVFDDDSSIATNGALYQLVFEPKRLRFWLAAGKIPVPTLAFTGFSLGELLDLPDAETDIPDPIQ